ncbi:hypothetical protein ACIA03_04135 [Nocardioides sp. NPDC051685]|uniref:hypothetical protein n=1 Tax=Nocardioides sp. NPDC051685 TaxID=3364334 RepID=UPI0037A6BDBB
MVESKTSAPGSTGGSGSRLAVVLVVVLLVLLVVLVVAAGAVAWRLVAQGSDDVPAPAASPSAAPPSAAPPSGAPPSAAPPTPVAPVPVPDGAWKSVTSAKDRMTYDVPPNWEPGPDTLAGFESPAGEVTALMHGIATYGSGWCDDDWHTLVGFVTPGSISDKGSIEATAMHWAKAAAQDDGGSNPTGSLAEPRTVKVDGGRTAATAVTATATPLSQTCPVPSIEVTVVSVSTPPGQALFVVVADRGAEGSNPDAALAKVIASLRPAR